MDSTDKHIKDLYGDVASGTVPDHLSWDNIHTGIYDRMPTEKRRVSPILWLTLGISIGLALAGIAYLMMTGHKSDIAEGPSLSTSHRNHDQDINTHIGDVDETAVTRFTTSPIVANTDQGTVTDNRLAVPAMSTSTKSTASVTGPSSNRKSTIPPSTRATANLSMATSARSEQVSLASQTSGSVRVPATASASPAQEILEPLAGRVSTPQSLAGAWIVDDVPDYQQWIDPNTHSANLWRLTTIAGANYNKDRYSNYSSMQNTTSGLWGQQAGILAARPIGKGPFYMELGVIVSEQNQRIAHEGIDKIYIDTTMMMTSINSLTGQTIAQRSVDTTMQVSRSRKLNYTNTVQRLHLRASLGHSIAISRKLQAHVGLGMQVSRTISQSGYYIDHTREYRLAGQSRPLYTRWSSEVIPSVAVEYNLSSRYAVYLGANSSLGITNGTAINDAHLHLRSLGLNAGMTMRL